MSALPPKADMCSAIAHVRYGPIADSCSAAKNDCYSPRSIRVVLASTLARYYCLGRLFGLKGVDQDLGGRSGRGRVLTGDQQSVGDDVDTPVFDLEKVAPRPSSSSSTRKGTTSVRPTSASSPSVNPVTFLPSTSGLPAA